MIRRVLVALDASPRAAGVVAMAAEIGRRFDADLIPLRVVFVPPEFPPAAHVVHGDPLAQQLDRDARRSLEALVASAEGARFALPLVHHGQPAAVILEAARTLDVDLVIVGSHGFGGWDRILGTTAARVASLADRSVLVVHGRPLGPSPRILMAIDDSDRAQGVVDATQQIAQRFDATIQPFRAIDREEHRDKALTSLQRHAGMASPKIEVGRAWVEILRAAVAIDCDLVVIGSHGYRGLDRLLGTTASRVVNLADRSVLVVHRKR